MSEEIKEIVDKFANKKQETLIQGLRECQLKDIEHPFITKEEYIDKLLNYITSLQQKVEQLEKEIDRLNNIIDNARKYIENNQSGCENENGHFHLNFDGDIWELYEMLRRF